MKRILGRVSSVLLLLCGVYLVYLGARRPLILVVDGQAQVIHSRALTVSGLLQEAGLPLSPADRLRPIARSWLGWQAVVYLERASQVQVYQPERGFSLPVLTLERRPGNLLLQAGIRLFPQDQIYWNGLLLRPDIPLPPVPRLVLQVRPAHAVRLIVDGQSRLIYSSASDLAEALWQVGIAPAGVDALSLPLDTPLMAPMTLEMRRARALAIRIAGWEFHTRSAAATVGKALQQAGITLQGLDYSIPGETQPLPTDGLIQVIRVREEILIDQQPIPFQREYVADANLELDQRRVVEAGRLGMRISRQRVRYENGVEVNRQVEADWVAVEPVSEKVGYGTKIVIRTLDTPDGPIEYWRAIPAYATSYSPCRTGLPYCSYRTASGMKLQKGIVGVASQYYRQLVGQTVYVAGYGKGVIADYGAGIPGKFLVDLGFSEEDFQPWHRDVTLYFLTPVPQDVPWILP